MEERNLTVEEKIGALLYLFPLKETIKDIQANPAHFQEMASYEDMQELGDFSFLSPEKYELASQLIIALAQPGAADDCLQLLELIEPYIPNYCV